MLINNLLFSTGQEISSNLLINRLSFVEIYSYFKELAEMLDLVRVIQYKRK
jgi:hypothetical protein